MPPAESAVPAIRFENVGRRYAGGREAVRSVSFDVPPAAFAVIVGPSGCGKTTLLKIANRLIEPTAGRVVIEGTDAGHADPVKLRRRMGYVIQQVGLFPHMTVAENIGVVPGLLGWGRQRIAQRIDELLALVHLPAQEYRDAYPRRLSGGQQQRVGLARALAGDPPILLMDEPFGAIDAIERARLQDEVGALQRRLHKTVLFVTHDVDEALKLGDTLTVMRDGRVEQSGTPFDVVFSPASDFVSDLVGSRDAVRRLSVVSVRDALSSNVFGAPSQASEAPSQASGAASFSSPSAPTDRLPNISASSSLRDALSLLLDTGASALRVLDGELPVGSIGMQDLFAAARGRMHPQQ
jgi:osmoprotectant transport system ATP-binding protein